MGPLLGKMFDMKAILPVDKVMPASPKPCVWTVHTLTDEAHLDSRYAHRGSVRTVDLLTDELPFAPAVALGD